MSNAEQLVKAVFPDAEMRFDWVSPRTRWIWSADKSINYRNSIWANGIWVGGECLVFGGKYEFELWRKAWKQIKKNMLKKLES